MQQRLTLVIHHESVETAVEGRVPKLFPNDVVGVQELPYFDPILFLVPENVRAAKRLVFSAP